MAVRPLPATTGATRPDGRAGTAFVLSWLWLGILVVVAASLPGGTPVAVRYTLVVILLYLLLTNLDRLAPLVDKLVAGLNGGTN